MPPTLQNSASLSGQRRASILLIALGSDLAAEVLRHCPEAAVERLTVEMYNTFGVSSQDQTSVLEDACKFTATRDSERQGGLAYVRELLVRAMGQDKGEEFLAKLLDERKEQDFGFLRDADPESMAGMLKSEHPQAIALVLSHLRPGQAAKILSKMERELQSDVAARIAEIERIAPEVVKEVEETLQKRLANALTRDESGVQWGGVPFLVQILNQERGMEKNVLDALADRDQDLADQVRNQLFTFDDLIKLDDRAMQRVLRDIDQKDLLLAVRGAHAEVRDHVLKNMSKRAAQTLEEELAIMRPARLSNIEAAQQRIVNVIRRLEESEEITVARGGQGDVLI